MREPKIFLLIVIIDYNAGNIKSIQNMLKRIGVNALISNQQEDIKNASKLILPGVGHFDYGMNNLKQSGLINLLKEKALIDKIPFLGICLGAQMLGNKSDEGNEAGLGWIDMDIVKFDLNKANSTLKIPHMGWSDVEIIKGSELFKNMYEQPRFYFVHSYHMLPKTETDILCTTFYGYDFVSGVQQDNIYGVQFHPEKSHKYGMKMLENFSNL